MSLEQIAQPLKDTPEGIVAGKISQLIAAGLSGKASDAEIFVQVWVLIRAYGNDRVKEARGGH